MSNPLAVPGAFAAAGWQACTSALRLDRWMLGELGRDEEEELRAHLEGCARCSAAAEALRQEQAQALPPLDLAGRERPPARVLPLTFPSSARAAPAPPSRLRSALVPARLVRAGLGLALAASVLLVLRANVRTAEGTTSLKGSGLGLSMYVQHGEQVRRAGLGEQLAPGDAIRFALTTPAPGYVAILSLDPSGRAQVYYPLGARAAASQPGIDSALPLSTRLDATVGDEKILALFCREPVELEPLRTRLEQGRGELSLPDGCQGTRWGFVKR